MHYLTIPANPASHKGMWRGGGCVRWSALVTVALAAGLAVARRDPKGGPSDISLWMDEKQVRMFSGISMEVFAIINGNIPSYILDPNFSHKLPVIPAEVEYANFTWMSCCKKYYYHFDRLSSSDLKILKPPVLSIKTKGRVPKQAKEFSIFLPCVANNSGVATFDIGLVLKTGRGTPLKGTPLRLSLKKECSQRGVYIARTGPDPECDKKCANQGWCNHEKICQCPLGYMGQYCRTALCYPQCLNGGNCTAPGVCSCPTGYQGRHCEGGRSLQCLNGGNCTAPGVCSCPTGYQGRHCEGGICSQKCLNGGKCIQKDTCDCPKGYYGLRCEFSKCVIPCLNGGRCKGVNKCRCPAGLGGFHCEIGPVKTRDCGRGCKHGQCVSGVCVCDPGWKGRLCHRNYGSSEESGEYKRPR